MRGLLVVARYNENTDWATGKLPEGWECRVVQKGVDLPNVGREASSFLWFMATQEIDPDTTYAFLQGDPYPHGFDFSQLREVEGYVPLGCHVLNADHDGHPHHGGLRLAFHLREWVGGAIPDRFIFHAGAQFMVPGRVILQRPRSWYAEMQARVSQGQGAWIMERLWPHVWPLDLPKVSAVQVRPGKPYEGIDLLAALHKGDPYAGAPSHPLDLQGWNGDLPIFRRLIEEVRPSLVIEVGTWKGQSASTMAQILRWYGGKIVCVDTWLGSLEMIDCPHRSEWLERRNGMPGIYWRFLSNMVQLGLQGTVVPFPQTSRTAARWLAAHEVKAGLVYLDASHEERDVADDLANFWPLVLPGGVLFGDDYSEHWPEVRVAVDAFAAQVGLEVEVDGPSWIIRKPEESA